MTVSDFSKHCVSNLDSSDVSLQLFSDVQISQGLLISWLCPANTGTSLLEAEITPGKAVLFSPDLYTCFSQGKIWPPNMSWASHHTWLCPWSEHNSWQNSPPSLSWTVCDLSAKDRFFIDFLKIKNILLLLELFGIEGGSQWEVPPLAAIILKCNQ